VPYQRVLVDRAVNAHKAPAYLKLNPNGLIPVLTQDDAGGAKLVLYETAAIVLHLCDTHPDAGLAPPLGSVDRAHFYKWLMWLTNTLQATLIVYFYPERWVAQGNAAGAAEVKAAAEAKIAGLLDQLDGELARHGQDWFMGATTRHWMPMCSPCAAGRATSPRCRRGAPASGPVPAAHAGAPFGAARDGGRAAAATVRVNRCPGLQRPVRAR
jgi:hypothetical protein